MAFFGAVALFGLTYIYIIDPIIKTKQEERITEHFRGVDARLKEIDRRSDERIVNSGSESSNNA